MLLLLTERERVGMRVGMRVCLRLRMGPHRLSLVRLRKLLLRNLSIRSPARNGGRVRGRSGTGAGSGGGSWWEDDLGGDEKGIGVGGSGSEKRRRRRRTAGRRRRRQCGHAHVGRLHVRPRRRRGVVRSRVSSEETTERARVLLLLLFASGSVSPLVPPPLPQPGQSSASSSFTAASSRSCRPIRHTRATATTSLRRLHRRGNERERYLLTGKDDGLHRVHRRDEVGVELSRALLLLLVMVVIPRGELIPVRFIAVEPGHGENKIMIKSQSLCKGRNERLLRTKGEKR